MGEYRNTTRRSILRKSAVAGTLMLSGTAISASAQDKGAQQSGKFQLDGTAEIINEPDVRPTNHVVQIDTSEDELSGSVSRGFGVQAGELDGQLSFDYNILSGNCGGGSPRLILSIDDSGDGSRDFYLVTDGSGSPGWSSCSGAQGTWASFNATDDGDTYWRQHPGSGFHTWSNAKALLSEDHVVLSGALVDDSFWDADASGVAMYDNVQIGDRTLSGNNDVVGRR